MKSNHSKDSRRKARGNSRNLLSTTGHCLSSKRAACNEHPGQHHPSRAGFCALNVGQTGRYRERSKCARPPELPSGLLIIHPLLFPWIRSDLRASIATAIAAIDRILCRYRLPKPIPGMEDSSPNQQPKHLPRSGKALLRRALLELAADSERKPSMV